MNGNINNINISPNRTYYRICCSQIMESDSTINPTSLVTGFAINDNVSNNPASNLSLIMRV